ncbi:hypothetical protein Gotri_012373 [Gossypium trilobum]|uniref:Uncharacterized protein n=1 Tax=Gossypium trilobum TaxID=34281 RepID=A0A7J9DQZ6_9ROSI|nr:hypothetical protein [Gossypium trilobum]
MIQNIWIIFSTRIQDYVSPQPQTKPQQNSFKQSRQLVLCLLKLKPRRNTKKSWLKCLAHWISNPKMRNL